MRRIRFDPPSDWPGYTCPLCPENTPHTVRVTTHPRRTGFEPAVTDVDEFPSCSEHGLGLKAPHPSDKP